MQNVLTITAEARNELGKKVAKQLRKTGRIPAIIYGGDIDSIPVSIDLEAAKAILKSEAGENTVLNIKREDQQVAAMIKDIQYDYLSEHIIHMDFYRIDLDKKVNVNVPVNIIGEAVGVKVEGGVFDFMTREIKIRCLPTQIPLCYTVDITDLHAGDTVKVDTLELGEGVRLMSTPQTVICSVSAKGGEEEGEEGEEGEEEAAVAAE